MGGTPWAHCYAFKLVIMGIGAYKVGGVGPCSSMRRRYPWQPCERPPPGTVTLNNSVEYLPTQYLPSPHQEGGRDGKNQSTNWHANSKQLQQHFAKNCKQATAYISHKVPLLEASGHPQNSWKNCCPKSDKHLFSSNNINTQSREKVVKIYKIILKGKML